MKRIPLENYQIPKYHDEDVVRAWEWFMSFISAKSWERRKSRIENSIALQFSTEKPFSKPLSEGTLMAVKNDVIGWYLYLVDMLINEPHKYEYFQGARVIPIFKRLGIDLEMLKRIGGAEKRVKDLLKKRQSEADHLLFELLTALLWSRNGYQVTLLEENNHDKTPDIVAQKDGIEWIIECKRQTKTSSYTYKETEKRQKMVSHIGQTLIDNNILLDINFHVELTTLPDTFLKDQIESKINLAIPGRIVSNEFVDIDFAYVNMIRVRKHLDNFSVKHNSPMLNNLIGGRPVDNRAFTCGVLADFFRVGDGNVNNLYISNIAKAYGVYWNCDADETLWNKARDIKSQLQKALKQLESDNPAVVHLGIESYDGSDVERKRFEKISRTIQKLNRRKTSLEWIYCHFFQAYSPPDQAWVFDETVSSISAFQQEKAPLTSTSLIVPDEKGNTTEGAHWERPLPY